MPNPTCGGGGHVDGRPPAAAVVQSDIDLLVGHRTQHVRVVGFIYDERPSARSCPGPYFSVVVVKLKEHGVEILALLLCGILHRIYPYLNRKSSASAPASNHHSPR